MKVSWLFDIGSYHWSTKAVTHSAVSYTAKVLPDSFDGIQMRWDVSRRGLITPSDLSFEVENTDGTLSRSSLEGQYCTIILITDGTESRRWKFKIQSASAYYGKMVVNCVDILQDILVGEYPNTPHPREVFPSVMHEVEEDDTARIPVIFGKAFIPLMLVYRQIDSTAYYALGKADSYTITKVMDPPSMGVTLWESTDYTFNQYTDSGYSLGEFMVYYDPETDLYSAGTWSSGSQPLVEYKVTGDADSLNPSAFLSALFQDFGLENTDLDSTTWAAASTVYDGWGLTWRGAFYKSEMRETIVNNLLTQCDSSLYISDKVELHPFSKTSQETFDSSKTKKLSFTANQTQQEYFDSGRVHWVAAGSPQSELSGKAIVPASTGGTTDSPSGDVFQAWFIESGVVAQKLGALYFQRKQSINQISFSTVGSKMSTLDTLKPGQVITVNDGLFGGSQDVIVTDLHIRADLEVTIGALRFGELNEFYDVSATDITIGSLLPSTFSSSAKLLQLRSSGQVFHYDAAGDPYPAEQTMTMKVYEQNLAPGNYVFTTTPNIKSQTSSSNTFTVDETEFGENDSVEVSVYKTNNPTSLTDTVTLVRVRDGLDAAGVEDTLDIQGWVFTGTFAALNATTVTWTSGAMNFSGGNNALAASFAIAAGSTGVMTQKLYIYFDQTTSETDLQVSTDPTDAVGRNKVLIAIAENGTGSAFFFVFGANSDVSITGGHIAAQTITGDKVVLNTLDASHINVGSILIGSLSGAGALAGLNSIDYSTYVTGGPAADADNTQDVLDLGASITYATVNGSTLISGGYLRTSLIQASALYIGDLNGASTVISNASTGATYGTGLINGTYSAYNTNRVNGTAASTVVNNAATGAAAASKVQTFTSISGGIISTGLIRNSANTMSINFDSATITVSAANGLIVSGDGGLVITSSGSIKLTDSYGDGSQINPTTNAGYHSLAIKPVNSSISSYVWFSGYKVIWNTGSGLSIGNNVSTSNFDSILYISSTSTSRAYTIYSAHSGAAYFTGRIETASSLKCSSSVLSSTVKNTTISTSSPSGGSTGDIWMKYV
jgi:hypothetical protein